MKTIKVFWQESFPYYLNDDKKNILLIAGLSLFLMVFLMVFQPMHAHQLEKTGIITCVLFIVLYGNIIWLPKAFPQVFNADNWTIGKYIVFTVWQLLIHGALASILIDALEFFPEKPLIEILKRFYISTLMYGSVCILFLTFIVRNELLKRNLRNALRANEELALRLPGEVFVEHRTSDVTLRSETSEAVSLCPNDLLYIEADDNYSTIYWKGGNGMEKKMLRVNLKSIESQLNEVFIVRCHRSFMVNVHAITHVSGNTNGYKLNILHTGVTIPVSRSKGPDVMERIGKIRNTAGVV